MTATTHLNVEGREGAIQVQPSGRSLFTDEHELGRIRPHAPDAHSQTHTGARERSAASAIAMVTRGGGPGERESEHE